MIRACVLAIGLLIASWAFDAHAGSITVDLSPATHVAITVEVDRLNVEGASRYGAAWVPLTVETFVAQYVDRQAAPLLRAVLDARRAKIQAAFEKAAPATQDQVKQVLGVTDLVDVPAPEAVKP